MTHRSESQDDMNRSTGDYVFWILEVGDKEELGGNRIEGDEVKGHLFLMKYKAL